MKISDALNNIIKHSCYGIGYDSSAKECMKCPLRNKCKKCTLASKNDLSIKTCDQLHSDVSHYMSKVG